MLLNDIKADMTKIAEQEGTTKKFLAEVGGMNKQSFNRLQSVNKGITIGFIEFLDTIGYDIEIVYKKKADAISWCEEKI